MKNVKMMLRFYTMMEQPFQTNKQKRQLLVRGVSGQNTNIYYIRNFSQSHECEW